MLSKDSSLLGPCVLAVVWFCLQHAGGFLRTGGFIGYDYDQQVLTVTTSTSTVHVLLLYIYSYGACQVAGLFHIFASSITVLTVDSTLLIALVGCKWCRKFCCISVPRFFNVCASWRLHTSNGCTAINCWFGFLPAAGTKL